MIDFETEARKFQGFRYTEVYGVHQLLADFGEAMYEKALDDAIDAISKLCECDDAMCDYCGEMVEAIRKLKGEL